MLSTADVNPSFVCSRRMHDDDAARSLLVEIGQQGAAHRKDRLLGDIPLGCVVTRLRPRQGLLATAVGPHQPDPLSARTIADECDPAAVGRPGWATVEPAVLVLRIGAEPSSDVTHTSAFPRVTPV